MKRLLFVLFAVLAAELFAFAPYDGYKCAFVRELEEGHKQTIVCYGTSLTAGHYCSNPPGLLQSALDARYPGLATVVNSGQGGQSSIFGAKAANIQSRVLDKSPDAVFIEWAINDAVLESKYDPATQTYETLEMKGVSCSLSTSLANIKSIVSQIKTALPNCEVILMTMNAVGVNNGTNNEVRHPNLEAYYNQYIAVADELGLLCLNHYANWKALKANDLATFNSYLADGLHPSAAGYQAVMMPLMISGTGMAASSGPEITPSNESDIFAWYRFENLGAVGASQPFGTVFANEFGTAHGLELCDFGRNGKVKKDGTKASLTRSLPLAAAGTEKFVHASENDTTDCVNGGSLSLKYGNVNTTVSAGTVLRVVEGASDRLNLKSFTVEFLYNARGHDFSSSAHWMAFMTRACVYHFDETAQKETESAGSNIAQPAIELTYDNSSQMLLRYTSTDDTTAIKSITLGKAIPADSDWHHYALTVDGSATKPAYKFYCDHQLFASGTLVAPIYYGDETPHEYKRWTFGGSYTGYALPGMIDEIRLAGRVLQPSEMLRLSDGMEPPEPSPTVWLCGDSTLCPRQPTDEIQSWGEGLRPFLKDGWVIDNRAISGKSSRSFMPDWTNMLSSVKSGDLVFIQFGHNDYWPNSDPAYNKIYGEHASHCEPDEYTENLRQYVTEARAKGAVPILLSPTPMSHSSGVDADHQPYYAKLAPLVSETGVDYFDMVTEGWNAATEYVNTNTVGHSRASLYRANDTVHPNALGAQVFRDAFLLGAAKAGLPVGDALMLPEPVDPGPVPGPEPTLGDVTAQVREAGAATITATYKTYTDAAATAASQAMFDGDTTTSAGCAMVDWNWNNSPWTVYYTIGDSYREGETLEITGYSIQRRYPDGVTVAVCNSEAPHAWDVYGSDDGTSWTKLDTRTGYRGTSKQKDTDVLWGSSNDPVFAFDFEKPVSYRHYRFEYIWQNNGNWATAKYSVQEVKLFGKVPPPPPAPLELAVSIDGADRPRAGAPLKAVVEVLSGDFPKSGVTTNWLSWTYDGSCETAVALSAGADGRFTPTAADYGRFVAVELVSDGKVIGASEPLWLSNLPVVYVTTDDGLEPTTAREGHTGALRIQGNDEFAEQYAGALDEVKVRGNSTAADPKKPWKLKLAATTDLFGFGKNKHWVLLTNYEDPSLMRNKTLYDLGKELGICAMDSTWVEVVFNGTYRGNYLLCEQIRVDSKRVDIFDWEKFVEDELGGTAEDLSCINTATNDISGGYLYEFDNYWDETSKFMVNVGNLRNLPVQFNRPEFIRTNPEMFAYATNRVAEYMSAIQTADGCTAEGRYWAELCDAKSAAAFFIVNVGFENSDGDGWSRYASIDRGGKLTWGPVWDFDNALGGRMSYWDVARDGEGKVTGAVPAVDPFTPNETSFCHDWFTAKYNRHEGKNLTPNVAKYDVNANFYPLWTDDPWFCLKLLEKWHSVSNYVAGLCRDGGLIDEYADTLERSANLNDARWTSSMKMERYPSAKALDQFKGERGNVWWLKRLYAERMRFMDEKTVSLRTLMSSLESPLNDHPYTNGSAHFTWSPLGHCKLPSVPSDGDTPEFVIPDYEDFRVSVACDDANVATYFVIVDDRALGEFPADAALTIPSSAFTETDGLDMIQILAKDKSGAILHRTYALVKHVTADAFALEPGEDLHADYKKTTVENYGGNDGVTFLKWEKTEGDFGRAWAVVVDMTKGYRFRSILGDGKGKKASPIGMSKALKEKGYTPLVGINGDFFFTDITEPTPTGMTITDSEMVHAGKSPNHTNTFHHIMQLADGSLAHGRSVRTDGSTSANPNRSYFVEYQGKKIRNAVRTNYTDDGSGVGNYPVHDGKIYDWGDLDSSAAANVTYPRSLVGIGKNAEGHDIMVLFVSDGRQNDWSKGVRKRDAAMMMIGAGCTEVGALDGGGSTAMWLEGYTEGPMSENYPGLVNKPSDGAPRNVGNGIFIVKDDEVDTVSVGDYSYPTLDEAMHAAGPGEAISVNAATTYASVPADLVAAAISSSAANPDETSVRYIGAGTPTVPDGVTLHLADLVFAEGSRTISAGGGTVELSGTIGLDTVMSAKPTGFRLAGPLATGLTVSCASATSSGDPFGTATVAPAAIASSLAHLHHPTFATLAAVARCRIDGKSNLYWSDGTFDTTIVDGTDPAESNDLTAKVRSAGAATITATYGAKGQMDRTAESLAMFDGDTVNAAGCAGIDWYWGDSPWTVYYTIGDDYRRDCDIVLRSYSVQRQYPDGVTVAVANNQSPFRWRLSGSKDGENWVELDYQDAHRQTQKKVATEGEPWGSANIAVQSFEIPVEKQSPYRHYKIDWIYNNQGEGAKFTVQEVKLFGDIVPCRPGFVIMIQGGAK